MTYSARRWQLLAFIISLTCSAVLFASYFYLPVRRAFWWTLDRPVARALNGLVTDNHLQQVIWSFGNLRIFDYVIAVCMLGILLVYAFRSDNLTRAMRCAQCIVVTVLLVVLVAITREVIFGHFKNPSPSLVLQPFTHLSAEITNWPWKIKDHSGTSFPGDHATVVATFTYLLWVIAGWRYGLAAGIVAIIAVLPRMIAGAHWFSDIVVGGIGTALLVVPWVVFTPVAWWLARGLARPLAFMNKTRSGRQQA